MASRRQYQEAFGSGMNASEVAEKFGVREDTARNWKEILTLEDKENLDYSASMKALWKREDENLKAGRDSHFLDISTKYSSMREAVAALGVSKQYLHRELKRRGLVIGVGRLPKDRPLKNGDLAIGPKNVIWRVVRVYDETALVRSVDGDYKTMKHIGCLRFCKREAES